eukprot:9247029-Prorocentrum_lima.AAC.1
MKPRTRSNSAGSTLLVLSGITSAWKASLAFIMLTTRSRHNVVQFLNLFSMLHARRVRTMERCKSP